MPKIKLTATLPCGTIATRTTARTYTHVVAVLRSYDAARANCDRPGWAKNDGQNWDYKAACANGTYAFPGWYDQATRDKWQADGAAFISANPSRAEYIAARRQHMLDGLEADRAEGRFTTWTAEGWAGRPDLAAKSASSLRATGRYADVQIVPVNA